MREDWPIKIAVLLTLMASVALIIVLTAKALEESKPKLLTDNQLEEMKLLKAQCEADNRNKECILMFDYYAVNKNVE